MTDVRFEPRYSTEEEISRRGPVDLSDQINEICDRLDVDPRYVASITIHPRMVELKLFTGREGRCKGGKFVDMVQGAPTYVIETRDIEF